MKSRVPVPHVLVCGKTYAVRWFASSGEVTDLGRCVPRHQRLDLSPDQTLESMQDTLLHEVLHALSNELRLELEEGQVQRLAVGLLDVLWHNPKFTAWLLERS
ncbi:MAG: hypothetical protein ACREBU_05745 [Nitrososphaera sp.]